MGRPSKYPLEFRREAAQMVLTSGRSMAEIARALGAHHKTLGNWVSDERRRARAQDPASGGEAERDELRRLRKEVAELREEREVLRKAALGSTGQRNGGGLLVPTVGGGDGQAGASGYVGRAQERAVGAVARGRVDQ